MRAILFMVLAGLLSIPARADDLTRRVGAGFNGGFDYALGSKYLTEHSDPAGIWGFWAKTGVNKRLAVGFSYDHLSFEHSDVRFQPQLINAFYQLRPESRWNPNVHAGIGYAFVSDVESGHKAAFSANAGLGADFLANSVVSFGITADYFLAARNSHTSHDLHVLVAALKLGFWSPPRPTH